MKNIQDSRSQPVGFVCIKASVTALAPSVEVRHMLTLELNNDKTHGHYNKRNNV